MISVLSEPARTVVAVAAFTGLRAGEIRGLTWDAYDPGDETSTGSIRVLRSAWRERVIEPKTRRSKAAVPLIPHLQIMLERHRAAMGNSAEGPIFANGAGHGIDLDSLYRSHMKARSGKQESTGKDGTGFVVGLPQISNGSECASLWLP